MSHMYMGFLSPLLNVWNSARETDLLLVLLCTQLFLYISVNLSLFMLCFVLHFSIYFVLLLILWVWGCLSLDIHLWHFYGIFVIWDLPYFGVLYGIPTQFLPSPLLRCIFQQPWFMLPEADTKKKKKNQKLDSRYSEILLIFKSILYSGTTYTSLLKFKKFPQMNFLVFTQCLSIGVMIIWYLTAQLDMNICWHKIYIRPQLLHFPSHVHTIGYKGKDE